MTLSRRELCSILLSVLGARSELVRARAAEEPALQSLQRKYRADATVLVLGVPIFSRQAVGSGFAALHEAEQDGRKTISLQFAGGSNPERTHNLNYCGSMEEAVVERYSRSEEASYFGFVTTSSEESYDQARRRIMTGAQAPSAFVAVEELHQSGRVRSRRAHIVLPDRPTTDWRDLNVRIRSRFSSAEPTTRELSVSGSAGTFLHSILTAARSPEMRSARAFVHNAREYRLECEKAPDRRYGAALAAKGLTARPERVIRLTGQVRDEKSTRLSMFRLWVDDGVGLPIRIEFQPRSYLRISLEFDPAMEAASQPKEKT